MLASPCLPVPLGLSFPHREAAGWLTAGPLGSHVQKAGPTHDRYLSEKVKPGLQPSPQQGWPPHPAPASPSPPCPRIPPPEMVLGISFIFPFPPEIRPGECISAFHFTGGALEAQRGSASCLEPHSMSQSLTPVPLFILAPSVQRVWDAKMVAGGCLVGEQSCPRVRTTVSGLPASVWLCAQSLVVSAHKCPNSHSERAGREVSPPSAPELSGGHQRPGGSPSFARGTRAPPPRTQKTPQKMARTPSPAAVTPGKLGLAFAAPLGVGLTSKNEFEENRRRTPIGHCEDLGFWGSQKACPPPPPPHPPHEVLPNRPCGHKVTARPQGSQPGGVTPRRHRPELVDTQQCGHSAHGDRCSVSSTPEPCCASR